jgi:Arm DNA-binding domain
MLTETEVRAIKPLRNSRKVSDGRGLYLLVTPKGGRCWRHAFRFAQNNKTLALGVYPDVSLELARSRHEFARNLLAHGLDPSALKAALGKQPFAAMMREWRIARGHKSHVDALKDILGALPIAVADEIQRPSYAAYCINMRDMA